MKNSFSKTLLCGVIASSFILINCQKAPNRGVKAQTAADGATGTTANADQQVAEAIKAGKVVPECSKEFIASYKTTKDQILLINKITAENKNKTLDTTVKDDLTKKSEELSTMKDATVAELEKLKADGCFVADAKDKTKKSAVYMKESIKKESGDLIVTVADKTGVESETVTAARLAKEDREKKQAQKSLAVGMEFIISKELADIMDSEHKDGEAILIAGEIKHGKENYDSAMADKTKTVCYITVTGDSKPDADSKMKVVSVNSKKDSATAKTNMTLGLQSSSKDLFEITCQLAEGKSTTKVVEFRNAMGSYLLTQKEEAKKTEKAAAAKAEETAKAEKAKTASEEAAKKQKADIEKAAKAAVEKAAADKVAKDEKTKKEAEAAKKIEAKKTAEETKKADDTAADDVVPAGP